MQSNELVKKLEAKLKTATLSNFALREENKRLNKLLSQSGLQVGEPSKIQLIPLNDSSSTVSQESPLKSGRLEELERQVSELTKERDSFKQKIAGYQQFKLPIAITEQQLEERFSEGDTQKFDQFARQCLVQGLSEGKLAYSSLDDVTESVCDYLEEKTGHKRWLCIIRPSIGETGLCAAFKAAVTYSFLKGDLEYKIEIIKLL